uniref:PX domain-containing protein n=1 Tax=Enterobius vermicularis TaxID=51028 RepID=A0A0N4VB05_ENTVE
MKSSGSVMMQGSSNDVTLPLRATITGWKLVGNHVKAEYVIEVEKLLEKKVSHKIQRRYAEFSSLSKTLEKFGISLGLPPKKVFGNLKEEFIDKRKAALQKFLDVICSHVLFYAGHAVTEFLRLYYPIELKEWTLLSVRSHPEWFVHQYRPYCGWRAEKQYFEVTSGKATFVLSSIRYGPDRCATMDQLNSALDFIRNINNPHLKECVSSWADNNGIVLVRPVSSCGTLRDRLYKSDWRGDFYAKYNVELSACSLQLTDVRFICRHVLEALLVLCALSIPFLDVHSGNVLVTDEGCELIDFDQVLAGQPNIHRPSMLKNAAVNSIEDMMVFSFGEFLFELLTGFFSLPMEALNDEIDLVPDQFRPLLKSIFLSENRKLPTLLEVASSDLFVDIPVARMNRREVRIPSHVKTTLDALCSQILERFQTDRNKLNIMRKEQKMQKFIFSESERQRRKQIIKKEQMSQSKGNKVGETQGASLIDSATTSPVTEQVSNSEMVQ